MQSDVEICNQALIAIGQSQISSLQDRTNAARLCARLYPARRDELLRMYDWNFARFIAQLPALADAPVFGYARAFALPADCLAMRGTDQDEDGAITSAWEVQGRTVVTDLSAPLNITYTRAITETALFDALFATALGLRIARDLALPLANSVALRSEMASDFNATIILGRGASYRESRQDEDEYNWLKARH